MDRRIIPLIMCGGAARGCGRRRARCIRSSSCRCSGRARHSRTRCCGCRMRRCSSVDRHHQFGLRFMVLEQLARSASRPMFCWSRCGAIPVRRSRPERCSRKSATAMPWFWARADHVVRDNAAFVAACRQGLVAADAGRIVTFGVQPERPAIEYGYISPVNRFRRCPRGRKIRREAGPCNGGGLHQAGYLWNSGNFMFRAMSCSTNIAASIRTACRPLATR